MGKNKDKIKNKKSAKTVAPAAPIPTPLGEGAHRAWGALVRSHAYWIEHIERRVRAQGGLSLEAYDVLLMLSYAPQGRLRMGALYEAVTLSRSGLTRLVDRLEKDGLVEREVCSQDRRSFEAILTAKGEAERARSWPLYAHAIADEFGRFFSEEEAGALAALLERPLKMDGATCEGAGNPAAVATDSDAP